MSQEENGGPSQLHLEPPFLFLKARESRARHEEFAGSTPQFPPGFGRRRVDDQSSSPAQQAAYPRGLWPEALYLENRADCSIVLNKF